MKCGKVKNQKIQNSIKKCQWTQLVTITHPAKEAKTI